MNLLPALLLCPPRPCSFPEPVFCVHLQKTPPPPAALPLPLRFQVTGTLPLPPLPACVPQDIMYDGVYLNGNSWLSLYFFGTMLVSSLCRAQGSILLVHCIAV